MKSVLLAVIISFCSANAIAQAPAEPLEDPNKERLGIRAGYVGTTSTLKDNFGGGTNLALHFIQRIKKPLSFEVTLGAFYMGRTDRDDITRALFGPGTDEARMRVIMMTVAPMLEFPVNEKTDFYLLAGGGLYIVSILLEAGLFQGDASDNHLGVTGGAGFLYHLTENWTLNANFQLHKFWTSTEFDDMFFRYSEGDQNPAFYQITVGAILRLF